MKNAPTESDVPKNRVIHLAVVHVLDDNDWESSSNSDSVGFEYVSSFIEINLYDRECWSQFPTVNMTCNMRLMESIDKLNNG